MDPLRFGDPENPDTRRVLTGIVSGIGGYGNCLGLPNIGGEIVFDPSYQGNPLVNALCIGTMKHKDIHLAKARGVGNAVILYGARTGGDGIGGVSVLASETFDVDGPAKRPSVQVGDPFMEKLLLEASLEIIKTGAVVGMQDMGAAGIICSTSEMSAKGKHGMVIHLDKCPTRQSNMKGWEILLSESQERMLVVVEKGREEEVETIFKKWDLNCTQIGEVTEGDRLKFMMQGELLADVPAEALVLGGGAPIYEREYKEPAYLAKNNAFKIDSINEPSDIQPIINHLVSHPNIASKRWVTTQYDSMVGTLNMTTNAPSDAAIVDVRNTNKALALTVDCNSRYVYAHAEEGCKIAVAEAARNIVCAGGQPSAVTNCLNFGNPYNPEVYWQFVHAIKGMSAACRRFETPVTGGNVSFYNQTGDVAIHPTPVVGVLGVIDNVERRTPMAWGLDGELVYVLGTTRDEIAGSEWAHAIHKHLGGSPPVLDLQAEKTLADILVAGSVQKLLSAAHDISEGGIAQTIAEMAMRSGIGVRLEVPTGLDAFTFLWSESATRAVVVVPQNRNDDFLALCDSKAFPVTKIGEVDLSSKSIELAGVFGETILLDIAELRAISEETLPRLFG
jgi:phosphoribosylformylglycinamidine synthase